MLRLDPGEGRIRTTREFRVWEGGGEYNVARGLRRCFGLRAAVVTAARAQRRRPAPGGSDLPGRRGHVADPLGAVRRHRPFGAQRTQLHRARFRYSRCRRLLRPGSQRRVSAARGRRRLGACLRQARCPLVPHRRHLRGALGDHRRGGDRGGADRQETRHRGLLRPQLSTFPLGCLRRPRAMPRGEPRHRPIPRRHSRQRRRLHGVPGAHGRGGRQEPARARGRRIPEA